MIDTMVLTIRHPWFIIQNKYRFDNNINQLFDEYGKLKRVLPVFQKFANNPTKQDYNAGIYKPRLTAVARRDRKGNNDFLLKIEFSASKIIYCNNVDEVEEKDFEEILSTLQKRIKEMGVFVYGEKLRNAVASAVHYSKNIVLDKGITSTMIIRDLGRIDLTKQLKLNKTRFRNEGHALYFDSGTHAIVLYDKFADITKDKRNSVDKDKTAIQLDLFEQNKKQEEPKEILKFEIRLTDRRKINSVLYKLGCAVEPTFKNLFNEQTAKKVINFYWQEYFIKQSYILHLLDKTPDKMLHQIIKSKKKRIPVKNALALLGFVQSSQISARSLRDIIEKHYSTRSWYRLRDWVKGYLNENKPEQIFYIKKISEELEKFEPVRAFDLNLDTSYNVNNSKK